MRSISLGYKIRRLWIRRITVRLGILRAERRIPIKTWASLLSFARCQDNVNHLSSGYEMRDEFPGCVQCYKLPQESQHRPSQKSIRVTRIHPVTVQFHENPVWLVLNRDGGLHPQPTSAHGRRV